MYNKSISDQLLKIIKKLYKKDKAAYQSVMDKIEQVLMSENPQHYKQLKYHLKDFKGVHVGHFVLTFKIYEETKTISFEDFDHHDNIYS